MSFSIKALHLHWLVEKMNPLLRLKGAMVESQKQHKMYEITIPITAFSRLEVCRVVFFPT